MNNGNVEEDTPEAHCEGGGGNDGGLKRKRTAIAMVAMELPHAVIFGCNAMNKPAMSTHIAQ